MNRIKQISGILLALMLLFSGVAHFVVPETFNGLIPDFLPKLAVNYFTGLIEVLLAAGVFIPAFRDRALLGICVLMICFLPVHILDALKQDPYIGTKTVAYSRIVIQFLLIWLPWFARKPKQNRDR